MIRQDLEAELAELDLSLAQSTLAQQCRDDINAFISYVFGVKQQAFHRKLQALVSQHRNICLDAPIEHGKTFQFSVAYPLWRLGRNKHETIAVIGNATENPERCLEVIRMHILDNPRLKEVFPDLELKESTKQAITVKRGVTVDKDASLVALGVGGSIIGRRWSGVVLDDIQDFDNTWTEGERRKLWKRLESTVLGRLIQGGWLVDIGTPWHVEDARHRLRRLDGFKFFRFDAMDKLWPELYTDPQTGKQYGWPEERLEQKRKQMSALEFDRQFRCMAMSASMAIFNYETIENCKKLGRGLRLGREAKPEDIVVTGVDCAIKRADTADRTAFFTGTPAEGKKALLDIRVGRWEIPDIARQVIDTVRRYPGHRGFRVENNAAQDYLRQVLDNAEIMRTLGATEQDLQRITIIPHTTTARKYDPTTGIRSMGLDFEQGRWIVPCDDDLVCEEPVQDWIDGLLAFDPASHTNDIVMASWLFSEEARRYWGGGSGLWSKFGIL